MRVLGAVDASGSEGARSIIVLSDGRDTSSTPLEDVTGAVEDAGVKVDVVALAQGADDKALLGELAALVENAERPGNISSPTTTAQPAAR